MKEEQQYAQQIIKAMETSLIEQNKDTLYNTLEEVILNIAKTEFYEIKDEEDPAMDFHLIAIFKKQRTKYQNICNIVNERFPRLLRIELYDKCIKGLFPDIYDWYVEFVIEMPNTSQNAPSKQ